MLSVLLSVLALSGRALAGPGPHQGACLVHDVRAGEPFSVTGTVRAWPRQGPLSLTDATGTPYALYGLGPPWFWRERGLPRPAAGDTLRVEGYELDCGRGLEKVATRVTVGGRTLELRDPATGLPAWVPPTR